MELLVQSQSPLQLFNSNIKLKISSVIQAEGMKSPVKVKQGVLQK